MAESHSTEHDRVCAVIQSILRGAQARHLTDDTLSASTGIPARTIKSYRVEGKEPSLSNALALAAALGKPAMNAILATVNYGGAHPLDEPEGFNTRQIIADILPHVSTIAAAVADGAIDHIEKPACAEAADHIIATVLPISSTARRD